MFSVGIMDLASTSILALEMAALIILNIGLPCRSVPLALLLMLSKNRVAACAGSVSVILSVRPGVRPILERVW